MGATKKDSLALTELTVNATFKLLGRDLVPFENSMRNCVNVVDYRVVPNTDYLYENDEVFRKLVKKESIARKEKQDYINKNNVN